MALAKKEQGLGINVVLFNPLTISSEAIFLLFAFLNVIKYKAHPGRDRKHQRTFNRHLRTSNRTGQNDLTANCNSRLHSSLNGNERPITTMKPAW